MNNRTSGSLQHCNSIVISSGSSSWWSLSKGFSNALPHRTYLSFGAAATELDPDNPGFLYFAWLAKSEQWIFKFVAQKLRDKLPKNYLYNPNKIRMHINFTREFKLNLMNLHVANKMGNFIFDCFLDCNLLKWTLCWWLLIPHHNDVIASQLTRH